jgi:hypothetical protein
LIRYRTEKTDAGMPMPALVSWMPMPTYDEVAHGGSQVGQDRGVDDPSTWRGYIRQVEV